MAVSKDASASRFDCNLIVIQMKTADFLFCYFPEISFRVGLKNLGENQKSFLDLLTN